MFNLSVITYFYFKGIVHPKILIFWKCTSPQVSQDVDFSIGTDLEKFCITTLAHEWILCSEWVPSEWVQTADKNNDFSQSLNSLWSEKPCFCKKRIHH